MIFTYRSVSHFSPWVLKFVSDPDHFKIPSIMIEMSGFKNYSLTVKKESARNMLISARLKLTFEHYKKEPYKEKSSFLLETHLNNAQSYFFKVVLVRGSMG